IWTSLRSGASLRLCFNSSGKLEYIYMPSKTASVSDDNVLVAKNKPTGSNNPFASLSGGKTPAQIYKNGIPAELSDLRQYDVGTYDKSSDTLFVSDLKLSGLYENAYPNAAAPSTVTVMGAELTVLPSAQADLAAFKVGDKVTLLLTTTGQVAGAVSPDVAKSNAVGVATVDGTKATIELLDGILTLEGQTTYSGAAAAKLNGCLVTVSSYKRDYLTLSKVNGKGASTALNLTTNRMGTKELSAGARFFEQVGNGRLVEIDRSDITITSIPANKITYVGYDWAGRVDKLVLNDVTGDCYDYGMIYYRAAGYEESKDDGSEGSYQNGEIRVTNGSHTDGVSYVVGSVDGAKTNRMGGVAGSLDQLDGKNRMAAFMPLNEATGIRRAQFNTDAMLLTTNSMVIPISDKVECYNKTTGDWFKPGEDGDHKAALNLALAFSDDITVYYDRSPEEGGKVRIVVVE
ncbi:S-layer homology domain-containing protein, partial [Flavonifractor plautii]